MDSPPRVVRPFVLLPLVTEVAAGRASTKKIRMKTDERKKTNERKRPTPSHTPTQDEPEAAGYTYALAAKARPRPHDVQTGKGKLPQVRPLTPEHAAASGRGCPYPDPREGVAAEA